MAFSISVDLLSFCSTPTMLGDRCTIMKDIALVMLESLTFNFVDNNGAIKGLYVVCGQN